MIGSDGILFIMIYIEIAIIDWFIIYSDIMNHESWIDSQLNHYQKKMFGPLLERAWFDLLG